MSGEIQGSWIKYQVRGIWRSDDMVLQILCLPDIRISKDKLAPAHELVSLVNEQMWLGHSTSGRMAACCFTATPPCWATMGC